MAKTGKPNNGSRAGLNASNNNNKAIKTKNAKCRINKTIKKNKKQKVINDSIIKENKNGLIFYEDKDAMHQVKPKSKDLETLLKAPLINPVAFIPKKSVKSNKQAKHLKKKNNLIKKNKLVETTTLIDETFVQESVILSEVILDESILLNGGFDEERAEYQTEVDYVCKTKQNFPPYLNKYWVKRTKLFEKYNEGVWMDEEGWFSVTPEKIARHLAKRMACGVIVDGFCGVGGNAIQFAKTCRHVIAIEMDPVRMACAKHNAEVYGVADRIEFILGDFFDVIKRIKADAIFLSPPWGGPQYNKVKNYDITTMMPFDGVELFNISRKVTPNIGYYLPRNTNYNQLGSLDINNGCEIEEEYSSMSFVAITAFYGPLLLSQ